MPLGRGSIMTGKIILKGLSRGIVATLVFFVLIEALLRVAYLIRNSTVNEIPLPYVMGNDYGAVPPWVDGLRILEPDETLFWKNRPNLARKYIDIFSPINTEEDRTALLRQFLPALPDSLKDYPVWEISMNSKGFRDREFPRTKPSSSFRIICLGDSWTFGTNVDQEHAYPQRLQTLLREEFPRADFEVFNLGVIGYSSHQGLELMRRRAIDLDPDIVVIGFAMNDSSITGYRDKDMPNYKMSGLAKMVATLSEISESHKLLRYLALLSRYKPKSVGEQIKTEVDSAQKGWDISERRMFGRRDYEKGEPWTRVSLNDYEKNILEMSNLASGRGAGVILLFNELWRENPYRTGLEKISRAEKLPLVDSSALIAEARRSIEEDLERKLELRPPGELRAPSNGEIEVVFRVYLGDHPVAKAVYIAGNHWKLGDVVPNKIAMYDDGTHGDQKAGDHVWSYSATFPQGAEIFYVFTNSGKEGDWEGLDVPYVRAFRIASAGTPTTIYRPIETFGTIYMQADGWHTNAEGYSLIANALLKALKTDVNVRAYLRQRNLVH